MSAQTSKDVPRFTPVLNGTAFMGMSTSESGDYVRYDDFRVVMDSHRWLYAEKQRLEAQLKQAETPARTDPLADVRWICSHCSTVNGIDDEKCLGCRKAREEHDSRRTAETSELPNSRQIPTDPYRTWMPNWLREFHCQCEQTGEGAGQCVACQAADLIAGKQPETTCSHPSAQSLRDLADAQDAEDPDDMIAFTPTALRRLADSIEQHRPCMFPEAAPSGNELTVKFPRAWAPYLQAVILGALGDMDGDGDCRWHLNELAKFLGNSALKASAPPTNTWTCGFCLAENRDDYHRNACRACGKFRLRNSDPVTPPSASHEPCLPRGSVAGSDPDKCEHGIPRRFCTAVHGDQQ